mmetsp:Transcript_19439/g.17228  ORF Transcript_19439/g.17228 Transcript_19439/m.17228 type:complete len:305 (-) Transcript_19439:30-944(-)
MKIINHLNKETYSKPLGRRDRLTRSKIEKSSGHFPEINQLSYPRFHKKQKRIKVKNHRVRGKDKERLNINQNYRFQNKNTKSLDRKITKVRKINLSVEENNGFKNYSSPLNSQNHKFYMDKRVNSIHKINRDKMLLDLESNDYSDNNMMEFKRNSEYYHTKFAWHGVQPNTVSMKANPSNLLKDIVKNGFKEFQTARKSKSREKNTFKQGVRIAVKKNKIRKEILHDKLFEKKASEDSFGHPEFIGQKLSCQDSNIKDSRRDITSLLDEDILPQEEYQYNELKNLKDEAVFIRHIKNKSRGVDL